MICLNMRLGGARKKFLLERRDRSTNEPPTPDTAGTGTLVDRRLLAAERLLGTHSRPFRTKGFSIECFTR